MVNPISMQRITIENIQVGNCDFYASSPRAYQFPPVYDHNVGILHDNLYKGNPRIYEDSDK